MADRSGIRLGLGITALMVVPILLFGGAYAYRLSNVRKQTDAAVVPLLEPMVKGHDLEALRVKGGPELQSANFKAGYESLRSTYGEFVGRKSLRVVSFSGGGLDAGNIGAAVFATEVEFRKGRAQLVVDMHREGEWWVLDGYQFRSPTRATINFGKTTATSASSSTSNL